MNNDAATIRELRIARKKMGTFDLILGVVLPVILWKLIESKAFMTWLLVSAIR